MTDDEAELKRLQLIRILADTERHLRQYAVDHWPEVLARSRKLIEDRDFRGVAALLSISGTMGSFDDIVIHPMNGNPVDEADIGVVNERFVALRGDIYSIAHALRRYENARPADG